MTQYERELRRLEDLLSGAIEIMCINLVEHGSFQKDGTHDAWQPICQAHAIVSKSLHKCKRSLNEND